MPTSLARIAVSDLIRATLVHGCYMCLVPIGGGFSAGTAVPAATGLAFTEFGCRVGLRVSRISGRWYDIRLSELLWDLRIPSFFYSEGLHALKKLGKR